MNEPVLVIGGGMGGMLASWLLDNQHIPHIGFESSGQLGSDFLSEHPRMCSQASIHFVQQIFPNSDWMLSDQPPVEFRKGNWVPANAASSPFEEYCLKTPFFKMAVNHRGLMDHLFEKARPHFKTHLQIREIDEKQHVLRCHDGSSYVYSRIIWCGELDGLAKCYAGNKKELNKVLRKVDCSFSGISVDLSSEKPPPLTDNTLIFPFRYKDKILRSLGVIWCDKNTDQDCLTRWLILFERDFGEDKEEVAKCLKTFRREFAKEFGGGESELGVSRVRYLSAISCTSPLRVESLEVLPSVTYLGSQVFPSGRNENFQNLDRLFDNMALVEEEMMRLC
ncbi:MAG: hypothetical protein HY537_11005 [Deltaproteobacteria bacterium]|nr:hypothetical protein [Deltaproteobacteria bacterium]